MTRQLNILFTQAQTYYASDARIHGSLMQHLDRGAFRVHAAINAGQGGQESVALRELRRIPDLAIHTMRFPPSSHQRARAAVARDLIAGAAPTLSGLVGLIRYARANRIDVIHCLDKARDTSYGLMAARASGARCVIHIHVKIAEWISPVVLRAMRHADALIGVSHFIADSIAAAGYPRQRIHTVLNGMDLRGWDAAADGAGVRAEFGVAPGAPLLAIVGRLFRWKGHADLIQALAQATREVPEIRLLIVGEDDLGAEGGASYRAELERMVAQLGLERHVIFTGQRSDVPRILGAADIFSMPSFEEPFGMVFIEAMAMRRPVVALDNGGSREIVEHGRSGLLSAPGDIGGLAEHIVRLARDPALREQMGAAGRARVEQRFTAQRMATDVGEVYRTICRLGNREEGHRDAEQRFNHTR